jgi:hypothetical protein
MYEERRKEIMVIAPGNVHNDSKMHSKTDHRKVSKALIEGFVR